jgi:hypothetical protein
MGALDAKSAVRLLLLLLLLLLRPWLASTCR